MPVIYGCMRHADLDIDALRAFVIVAEAGGFTAAGDILGRTQSAVSIKIKKLEDVLGRRVFDRTSRSLALTRDGELLLGYARRMLALNDEAVRRFAEPDAEGDLRLGVAEYFLPRRLPRILTEFRRVYPRVHIAVRIGASDALVQALDKGELDVVIAKRDEGVTRGRVIRREAMRWICAPDLDPDPVAPLPFCALPAPCVFRSRGLQALEAQGRSWRVVYTSESVMGVLAAAEAGLGVAVVGAEAAPLGVRTLTPEDGFPELGEVEHAVFGEGRTKRALTSALVGFVEESL